jgi:hypothetical protein
MVVSKGGLRSPRSAKRGKLLREAENSRLAREARRRRREAGREWKINLGGWTLQLRRIPDYETSQAAKG